MLRAELCEGEVEGLGGEVVDVQAKGDDEHGAEGEDHVRGAAVHLQGTVPRRVRDKEWKRGMRD